MRDQDDYYPDPDLDPDFEGDLDPEGPSAEDLDRFGGDTVACPRCAYEVYDEATVCPRCGEIFDAVKRASGPKKWLVAVGMVLLAAVALVLAL